MKKFIAMVSVAVLALSLASVPAVSAQADESDVEWTKMTLTVSAGFPDDNVAFDIFNRAKEKIDERMDGAISFEYYGNNTLVAGTEIYDGVINGATDIGFWQTSYASSRFPILTLFDMPGLAFSGSTAASYAVRDFINENELEEISDVHVLMPSAVGSSAIVFADEITTVEDLAGKQVRAAGFAAKILELAGAIPTSMEWSECYEGLRTGLVDGVYSHLEACCNANLYEVAPNVLILPFNNSTNVIIMNKEKFESMPVEQQELLDEIFNEVFEEYGCLYMCNPELIPKMQEGIPQFATVNWLEGEELEKMMEKDKPMVDEYIQSLNDAGYDGDGAYARMQELVEKYNAEFPAEEAKARITKYIED